MEKSQRNGSAGKRRVSVCSVINFSPATQIARILPSTTTSAWMMWPLSSVRLQYPLFVVLLLISCMYVSWFAFLQCDNFFY